MSQMPRPKGVPRAEWKLVCAQNARSSKKNQKPQKKAGKKKDARWHFGVNTAWGGLSMGSGDKAVANLSGRSVRQTQLHGVPTTVRRELLADVLASNVYQCNQYSIQPGDSSVFEWGAPLATRFQKWKCRRLGLEYVPTVSGFADGGKQGRIVLAGNYNPLTPQPADIRSAVAITPNVPGFPTRQFSMEFDPDQISPVPLLVRAGIVPAGGTVTSYDGGVFYVVVEGSEGLSYGTKLGEVYVTYEFEFFEPIIPGVTDTPHATFQSTNIYNSSTAQTFTSGVAAVLQNLVIDPSWNGLGITYDGATGALQMQPGRYVFHGKCSIAGSTSLSVVGAFFTLSGPGGTVLPNSQVYESISGTNHTALWQFAYSSTVPFEIYPCITILGVGTISIQSNQGANFVVETL